jgi:hypothetical protein
MTMLRFDEPWSPRPPASNVRRRIEMSHDRTFPETEALSAAGSQSDGGGAWAWATEHGAPEMASTEQLIDWLARGELPPHVLVWRPGWGEWLPAMQVAELAAAFPSVTAGSRRVARVVQECTLPPAVPVEHYPRLRLLAKDVLSESPLPPAAAVLQGHAPAQAGRRGLRDLDHMQQELVTSQVPAAAMGERTLSPLAVELSAPALVEPQARVKAPRRSGGYGRWLAFGALVGGGLGFVTMPARDGQPPTAISALQPAVAAVPEPPAPPPPALDSAARAPSSAEATTKLAPPATKKAPGVILVKRKGEPALQQALRVTKNDGFDRVVFEFRERVPGYRLEYVDKPARDCVTGEVRRIAGDARLAVRLSPAAAHTEDNEATVRERELKPALRIIREIERTCDFDDVVTWLVGTSAAQRYRAYELSTPPRLVLEIEH